ncbi:MAG: type III toxin-antitoxin system ToxN/AbiQ family toxin [Lachnospiraceae bacterium]|nr:type III toxin-antitoxin system ToxN/AbiQ family toxin [Lachnospiraceae bacterium]
MQELKIYSVSDSYIEYLRQYNSNVYSNKVGNRTHTRKYIGVVIEIAGYKYYIPMSSPKETDYQVAGNQKVIKKSIIPIIRMAVKNSKGEKELKGTLRISHMIPVPENELELFNLDNEADSEYKDLVQNEVIFIRKNREKIIANAQLLYKQKKNNDQTAGYVKSALDYAELERLCDKYKSR